ncbi:MAG: WD40 repeat domain-containing protein, partial [Planctomycetes bacterium]|nr:WD40 repeat domain-containing protein [Planctomycetota bacterium]
SLVRAGVLPTITQPGVLEGIGLWRWTIFRPGEAPGGICAGLAASLLKDGALPEMAELGLDRHELGELLRDAPQRAAAVLRAALARIAEDTRQTERLSKAPEARVAVVVDQLEEIFTLAHVDAAERNCFMAAVAALSGSGVACVLATMRSDFYARTAELPRLVELKEGAGTYHLLPPSFAEVEQMIVQPALAAGLRFETDPQTGERLDKVLHEAAARHPHALPLLEFTLDRLYAERIKDQGLLTFAAYRRLGGIEGAIGRRAEDLFGMFPPSVQETFPQVMRSLATVHTESEGEWSSRPVPRATLSTSLESGVLVEALVRARLLVTEESHDGGSIVAVAHEAMFRQWPRLAECLSEDREFLQVRQRVHAAAERWDEEGQSDDFLLPPGKPLAEAEETLLPRKAELEPLVLSLVTASVEHRAQLRAKKRARVVAVVGSLFAVVLVFLLFYMQKFRDADVARQRAEIAVSDSQLSLYAANVGLGQQSLRKGDIPTAVALLEKVQPAANSAEQPQDLRAFEWYYLKQACEEKLVLFADAGVVHDVAVSPDGRLLATTGFDNAVRVWDARTGEERGRFTGHESAVFALAIAPDGRRAASGDFDGKVFVWDLETQKTLQALAGHDGPVTSAAFSPPDGRWLITGGDDDVVRQWDLLHASGTELWAHRTNVHRVAFSPDGKLVASTSGDGVLKVGPPIPGAEPADYLPNAVEVYGVAFGRDLVVPVVVSHRPTPDLYGVAFSRDGSLVVAGRLDGTVQMWDTATRRPLVRLAGHTNKVQGVAFSPDDNRLVTADEDGVAIVWKREPPRAPVSASGGSAERPSHWLVETRFPAHAGAVYSVAFFDDGHGLSLATSSGDGSARVFDAASWTLKTRAAGSGRLPSSLVLPFASTRNGAAQAGAAAPRPKVTQVAFSPGGRWLAAGDQTGRVIVWEVTNWRRNDLGRRRDVRQQEVRGDVNALVFAANDSQLIAGVAGWDSRGCERLWELQQDGTWRERPLSLGHDKGVTSLALSYDGRWLASASFDRTARLFDVSALSHSPEPAPNRTLPGHAEWAYAVAFSRDGALLATAAHDRTVRLWNVASGKSRRAEWMRP